MGSFGLVKSIANALGEEIGWRGFLVPELFKTTGLTGTALFSGVVWALWHYPVLIGADYNAGTPTWYGLTCFTVAVLPIVVIAFAIFFWSKKGQLKAFVPQTLRESPHGLFWTFPPANEGDRSDGTRLRASKAGGQAALKS